MSGPALDLKVFSPCVEMVDPERWTGNGKPQRGRRVFQNLLRALHKRGEPSVAVAFAEAINLSSHLEALAAFPFPPPPDVLDRTIAVNPIASWPPVQSYLGKPLALAALFHALAGAPLLDLHKRVDTWCACLRVRTNRLHALGLSI